MKYAFVAVAAAGVAVATPAWQPEGYGAPAYQPESTTSCTEETWTSAAPTAPAYEHTSWAHSSSSSAWVPSSSSWVESSSAPAPPPYHSASSSWVESSSSAVWTSSHAVPTTSVWSPVSESSTWVHTSAPATQTGVAPPPYQAPSSSVVRPVGTAPGPKVSPSGYAAPSGVRGTGSSGAISAPTPTGSPITPYKGAANAVNAAGLLAGVGAVAALFL